MPLRPPRVLLRLARLFTWHARDRDMEQEMSFHVDALRRDYERAGLTPAESDGAARRRFGNITRLKEQGNDVRTHATMEGVVRDVRHAGRGLRRTPGFAITVILTLAVGIGGNTAIFSVVDQLLLRPLPYREGDRLVMLRETMAMVSSPVTNSVSPANWLDWQRDSQTVRGMAAWRTTTFTLTGAGEPLRINAQRVSAEFFPVLDVAPLHGRTINESDDRPGAPDVAVLSYGLWRQRFGGNPAVIGQTIQLSDRRAEIVGVMPDGFRFVHPETDLWTAFRLDRNERWRETSGRFINVVGRMAPGATLDAVRAEMFGIARRLEATYAYNKHASVVVVPLRSALTGQVASSLLVLYAAVGVLLSIACFNVANLLLARAASRRREIAIRTSLGAGRLAIVRQLLVESVLLASAGGLFGILLARWSLDALQAFAPPDLLRVPELFVDRRILLYALALSVLTGVVVGLAPALLAVRRSIVSSLRASGPGATHTARVRQWLVVGQVALSVILLCGAGLLVRTMMALDRNDNGLERSDLLTMEVALPQARYAAEKRVQFYRDAIASLRALPGVTSAAAADSLAIIGNARGGSGFHRLGAPQLAVSDSPSAVIRVVTPGYFHTLQVPILRGREFSPADDSNPAAGFVVNEAFAKAYLGNLDPLAASISVWMEADNPYLPVIGVVGNLSEGSVRELAQPTVYYSHRRLSETAMTIVVRGHAPESLTQPTIAAIHAIDASLAVTRVRTFDAALAESLARERLNALVSGGFALSGLLLASLGVYGLLAFLVAERTKEIGIRIALGAHVGRLTRSVLAGGLRLVGAGAALGVAGALVLLRSFGALLFGVTPYDLPTYGFVLILLTVVAAVASYVPARRAARVQPLLALRQD